MKDWKKLGWLLGLIVVLVGLNWYRVRAPAPEPAAAGTRPTAAKTPDRIPDAALHLKRLEAALAAPTPEVSRNIFEYGSRPQAAVKNTKPAPEAAEQPPPPPPPPKPPVRFFGFAEGGRSGARRVFLTDGEEVFIASQGEVILRRYRLVQIGASSVTIEEVAGPNRWEIPLEQP